MKYNFDLRFDRVSSGCWKWNRSPGAIPMWVAEMDFPSPPPVIKALRDRVAHEFFGYENPEPSGKEQSAIVHRLKTAIVNWLSKRYYWPIAPQDIVFLPGLVSALNLACRAYCNIGDGFMMLEPIYPPFRRAPKNNDLVAYEIPLKREDCDEHVKYGVDF